MNPNQIDLFGAPEEKSYPGANGVKLPYFERDGKITHVAFSDKLILPVTYQKGGHIYCNVPDYGRLEFRGKNAKTSFLRTAALIHRSLELNKSIAGHGQSIVLETEEQGKIQRAALEILVASGTHVIPRPRSTNKLALPFTTSSAEALNFFNPKPLIGPRYFSPVPTWLTAVKGMTPSEQLVYAAMIFRADEDGTFRRSLLGLGKLIQVSDRGIQKAAESLENRNLIFKATSRSRIPNEYKFVWRSEFERSDEQCSLEFERSDEQSSEGSEVLTNSVGQSSEALTNSVGHSDEQSSLHKNRELSQEHEHDHVHAPVGLTPAQEDLINQINELTESESRSEHFRTLWIMCVKEDPIAVFQAIGETRRMKSEGKIKKTIGGTLRWHYTNFHAIRTKMKPKR